MTPYVELVAAAVWLVLGFLGTIFTPGEDKALGRVLIWTTVICTFSYWFIVYQSQKNPILYPMDSRFAAAPFPLAKEAAERWAARGH